MKTTTKFKFSCIILKLMKKIMFKIQYWLYTINTSNCNLAKDDTIKELWDIRNTLEQFITDHWREFDNKYKGVESSELKMLHLSSQILGILLGYCNGAGIYKIDKD